MENIKKDINLEGNEPHVIGKYGRMRERYLKNYKYVTYINLLYDGKLKEHIADVDKQAKEYLDRLIPELVKQENVTEDLKNTNPLEWVGRMNNIKNRVEEIIYNEIIYQ